MDRSIWIVLVVCAGAFLPIQAGWNSRIGRDIQNPVWASVISFAVGLILLLLYALLTKQKANLSTAAGIPLYYWLAGGLGAFFICISILAFPVLGAGLTFSLVVTSQMLVSLFLDHFKILVQQQQTINFPRIMGLLLIVIGVVLIRRY